MAVCEKCGKDAVEGAKFCKTCGSGLGSSSHDDKKKRVLGDENKSWKTPFIVAIVVVALVAGFFAYSSHGGRAKGGMMQQGGRNDAPHTEYAPVSVENNEVSIPESALEGGRAKYFIYTGNGTRIKFFAIRANDGTVRVALDACSACYHAKLGYRQEGGAMVCNNCGMGFNATDVGKVTGGCSPIPVEKKIESKMIVVKASELEAGAKYF